MKINPTTMLFENLNAIEAAQLEVVTEAIVMHGDISGQFTQSYFREWCKACKFDSDQRQGLLLISAAFPQRALLSLVRHHKEQRHDRNT